MNPMDDPRLIEILTRIEVKLTNLEDIYKAHLDEHSDHETRIRALEKKVWTLPSLATILAVLAVVLPFLLA